MFLRVASVHAQPTSSSRDRWSGMGPTFALSEAKLRQPTGRPGIVDRPALVELLRSVENPAVISIVAPAG